MAFLVQTSIQPWLTTMTIDAAVASVSDLLMRLLCDLIIVNVTYLICSKYIRVYRTSNLVNADIDFAKTVYNIKTVAGVF